MILTVEWAAIKTPAQGNETLAGLVGAVWGDDGPVPKTPALESEAIVGLAMVAWEG